MKKRFSLLLGVIGIFVLGIVMVQAQNGCGGNISDEDCELLFEALNNFQSEDDLDIYYRLSNEFYYGASQSRQVFLSGNAELERNRAGQTVAFEGNIFVSAYLRNEYDILRADTYFQQLFMTFEENEFAFAEEGEDGRLIEVDIEQLDSVLFLTFLGYDLLNDAEVQTIEIDNQNYRHYQFNFERPINENPFSSLSTLILGQEVNGQDGTGFYSGTVLVDLDASSIAGLSYNSSEFLDGEAFGQIQPVRHDTNYFLMTEQQNPNGFEDFDIDDEFDDENAFYETAAEEEGVLGLVVAALAEPLSELFPPIVPNTILGGRELGGIIGAPDETNTPTLTPRATTTPTNTPRPTATEGPSPTLRPSATPFVGEDGFPCNAVIDGEEGEIMRVVHQEPTEDSSVIRAVRGGQSILISAYVDNREGRWVHIQESNRSVGYIHEDYVILGEECPE